MAFRAPTFRPPHTIPERQYPPGVVVENELRCWAISGSRLPIELADFFLKSGYAHLPTGTANMYTIDEVRQGGSGLKVTFTNPYDAYALLGHAFWCGTEFICFTNCNIFTNWDSTFPTRGQMHGIPYIIPGEEEE